MQVFKDNLFLSLCFSVLFSRKWNFLIYGISTAVLRTFIAYSLSSCSDRFGNLRHGGATFQAITECLNKYFMEEARNNKSFRQLLSKSICNLLLINSENFAVLNSYRSLSILIIQSVMVYCSANYDLS